jgi:hypothetical protein
MTSSRAMTVAIEFVERKGLDGVVTIHAEGQPEVELTDEPHHQIRHLAAAIAELVSGRSSKVAIPYWSQPGGFELEADGDDIVVSGDYIEAARFPRQAFARAAIAAAERWLARAAEVGDDAHLGLVPLVTEALTAALAALAA